MSSYANEYSASSKNYFYDRYKIERNLSSNFNNSSQSFSSTRLNNLSDLHQTNYINNQTDYVSQLENQIISSDNPLDLNETEEITVNGERGIWANKNEVINWKSGDLTLNEYKINQDPNPKVINKKAQQEIEYIQEIAIRYLRPPTPPAPGEIIINQLANSLTPPAPPLIIRQQPVRPATPQPIVVREVPPPLPAQIGKKIITISGKKIPPPPRKVIIERLAPLPAKPQPVIVERWLPYAQVKRRVIFNKPKQSDPIVVKPRNIIVQWESPQVNVKKEYKYLGVIRADPVDYVKKYSSSLTSDLPDFIKDVKIPDDVALAANQKQNQIYELEGDVEALSLVDLEKEGLSEYKDYLKKLNISSNYRMSPSTDLSISRSSTTNVFKSNIYKSSTSRLANNQYLTQPIAQSSSYSEKIEKNLETRTQSILIKKTITKPDPVSYNYTNNLSKTSSEKKFIPVTTLYPVEQITVSSAERNQFSIPISYVSEKKSFSKSYSNASFNINQSKSYSSVNSLSNVIEKIFRSIDRSNSGRISVEDAEKILLRLNSRLGRRYGEDDVKALFAALDINNDNSIDLKEFKRAFLNLSEN